MSHQEQTGQHFKFRKGASVGEPDAESDTKYLADCFVNTGDYATLVDCESPQRILVGRTGTGKSALIYHLKQNEEHVIEIHPEELSLNYLSNSDLLNALEKSGVKLDLFYTLLWRHIFVVEFLKYKYDLVNQQQTENWLTTLLGRLKKSNEQKERALKYLQDWGDKFWLETDYRVKEVTQKLESDLKTKLGADIHGLTAGVSEGEKFSEEKKIEIIHKAQTVVNSIQLKSLSDVMTLLSEDIFNDPQQKYYLVIDKLDENWIDDQLRHRLIRALIETVKYFRSIKNIKIIIALRVDLLQKVFDSTRDAGFQEEKYQALFLKIHWSRGNLEYLLDRRVEKLIREQYTKGVVKMKNIFPDKIGRVSFLDYFLTRTLFRPRDAIFFVNECLRRAEGKGLINTHTVFEAEREYSAQRIDSLRYEWFNHYPYLQEYLGLFERMPPSFKLSTIGKDKLDALALKIGIDENFKADPIADAAYQYLNYGGNPHAFLISIIQALFTVGVIGIKPDSHTQELWSYQEDRPPTEGQIKPSSIVRIHPMLWSRLGIVLND